MIPEIGPRYIFKVVFALIRKYNFPASIAPVLILKIRKRKKHEYVVYVPLQLVKDENGKPYYSLNDQLSDVRELVKHHFKISAVADESSYPTILEECLTSSRNDLRKAALRHLEQSKNL